MQNEFVAIQREARNLMKIQSLRLRGIRCFEDTGDLVLSPGCNIFVGQNNAGKSTVLKAATAWQIQPFNNPLDVRPGSQNAHHEIVLSGVSNEDYLINRPGHQSVIRYVRSYKGEPPASAHASQSVGSNPIFDINWPRNFIQPFIAKRKASSYGQSVNRASQNIVDGTFSNLYAKIDDIASPGKSAHKLYRQAVEDIVGALIVTRSSVDGKEAGYYWDDENFVTLERMGDGVSEIVALIVDLSQSNNRVFVLEEPETNLHPRGLKALLEVIREASSRNQFIVATHSNIVVRELAADPATKLFRVYREGEHPSSPSEVVEVARTPSAHREILQELGYEFGDFDLHEGWLFLEEASAETVIREILIPFYAPKLVGRLRTFSAAGVTNLEPSVAEFQRLISFVHLDPVYRDRLWVRADGDAPGRKIIASIHTKFPYLEAPRADVFEHPQFELFYPEKFANQAMAALAVPDKAGRAMAKSALRQEIVEWSLANETQAREAWSESAAQPIQLLTNIEKAMRAAKRAAQA